MAATITTMALINAKFPNSTNTKFITSKPTSLLSLQNLPKGLATTKATDQNTKLSTSITGTALAGAILSTLAGSSDSAYAAQQIAEGDNRGLALLLPIIPAIAWVLFNILQPALNQLNRMRSDKGVILGLGVGGLVASSSGLVYAPDASASEIGVIAEAAAASDNRGQLLLFVVTPAIVWVLYNILQPALNQLNRMRSQ